MTAAAATPATGRIASIDMIRGAVMVLMAIDHVRVYSGLPAGGPTPGIFFTRWITHFCAPAFIFLAGTSAFLYGRRHADLSRFLLRSRLVARPARADGAPRGWTFNFDFATTCSAGVIWVIGWCMVLMAGLVRLPVERSGRLGIAIIASHNAVDAEAHSPCCRRRLCSILYIGVTPTRRSGQLMVLYPIVPWIGVMAAGYAFGTVLTLEPARRRRICSRSASGAHCRSFSS